MPKGTANDYARVVQAVLEPARNSAQAEPMARYMRGLFPFLGLKRPEFERLVRPVWTEWKPQHNERLICGCARELWKLPEREYHHAALDLLMRHERMLTPKSLPVVRALIVSKSWWDTVDALATRIVGPLVARHPDLKPTMDAWSRDKNLWIRRTAILHQLGYKKNTDIDRLFDYCARNASDSDFFIRKAIGWALRQYARTDPAAVKRFVKTHPDLSPLSKREATKHLD